LPGTTLQFQDAFQKANKDFDLIYMANHNHIAGYNVYTAQRIEDYLLRYLEGAAAPDWDSLPASSSVDASHVSALSSTRRVRATMKRSRHRQLSFLVLVALHLAAVVSLAAPPAVRAQTNSAGSAPAAVVTRADYARAESLDRRSLAEKLKNGYVVPRWIGGTDEFCCRRETEADKRVGREALASADA
jgi:hypothetical protein